MALFSTVHENERRPPIPSLFRRYVFSGGSADILVCRSWGFPVPRAIEKHGAGKHCELADKNVCATDHGRANHLYKQKDGQMSRVFEGAAQPYAGSKFAGSLVGLRRCFVVQIPLSDEEGCPQDR